MKIKKRYQRTVKSILLTYTTSKLFYEEKNGDKEFFLKA